VTKPDSVHLFILRGTEIGC